MKPFVDAFLSAVVIGALEQQLAGICVLLPQAVFSAALIISRGLRLTVFVIGRKWAILYPVLVVPPGFQLAIAIVRLEWTVGGGAIQERPEPGKYTVFHFVLCNFLVISRV